ncbi:PAS domain-containing sensor histidine kinase [Geomonas sp. RF6]|uniref:sensor histidine kinase n=1 Tax=Geomonas sp. RF6 TaxID=2897342 RepID=UPI001E39836D|nr:PAS domain-containing sensor histidine kinase [Geomonas sp. RF6]UFS71426.1 PAS domain-containing sensor histidine kinase [Geomonas sp. RF6]
MVRSVTPTIKLRQIVSTGLALSLISCLLCIVAGPALGPGRRALLFTIAGILIFVSIYIVALLLRGRHLETVLNKYQAGMDAAIDAICLLNEKYECIYVNTSFVKLYGYDSHVELIGKRWCDYFDGPDSRRFEEEIFPVLAREGEWRGEAISMKRDGTPFTQEASLTQMTDRGIVCIVRDVTRRKAYEDELQRKARELSLENVELEAFGYSLSHDIRSYLTRSSSALQILQEHSTRSLDEFDRYLFGMVCEANAAMEELVNAMLTLSQISRRGLNRELVNVTEMALGIAAELALSEPVRPVAFLVDPRLEARCDPHLVKIALENLLGNAWKFTRHRPYARVRLGVVDLNGRETFFLRDNGIGFELEDTPQLFEPFQRLQNAKSFPGCGIGLATVRRVFQRHGGEIWAEGKAGKGATFYFTIPQ